MTKVLKKLFMKYAAYVASFMFIIGVSSCSQACCWWFAQPKVPEALEKFKSER